MKENKLFIEILKTIHNSELGIQMLSLLHKNSPEEKGVADVSDRISRVFQILKENYINVEFSEFEKIFYSSIILLYKIQRYSTNPVVELLDIRTLEDVIKEPEIKYLEMIYEYLKSSFERFLSLRCFDLEQLRSRTKAHILPLYSTGNNHIKSLNQVSQKLINIMPKGEIANRLSFLSLINKEFNKIIHGYSGWNYEYNRNLDDSELIDYHSLYKYFDYRKNFIDDCYLNRHREYGFFELQLPCINSQPDYKPENYNENTFNQIFWLNAEPRDRILESYSWLSSEIVLSRKNDDLIRLQKDKDEIIQSFTHRYKNMQFTTLLNTAEYLMKYDDTMIKEHGITLLIEYSNRRIMTTQVKFLQLIFTDRIEEMRSKFIESIDKFASSLETVKVYDLLGEILRNALITSYFDSGSKIVLGFLQVANKFWNAKDDFRNNVIFNENCDVINWFTENLCSLKVEIGDIWNKIFFKKEGMADVFIKDILAELIRNVFKYADKKEEIVIKFTEQDDRLIILMENTILEDVPEPILEDSTKHGLKDTLLKRINEYAGIEGDAISFNEEDYLFTTRVTLPKSFFLK